MKVVLGFSGGVDSAVSAALLRRAGWEVCGLYLDNTDENARRDAVETAAFLELPLEILDVRAELEEKVCAPTADRLGAEAVATGHYARAEGGALYKGRPANDQSYMLCRLRREQLDRLVLPLGGMEKTETRALAERLGLPVAHKKDSMEICFIPDRDYVGWLSRRGELPGPGPFLLHGRVLGEHAGIVNWTVGQRIPGLYEGRKLYVSRIDAASNSVELAPWEELFKTELTARDFNWLVDEPKGPVRASVRVRHTKWEEPACTASPLPDGSVRIVCDAPVRAPAPGQSAVLYDGDKVLGGGFIV